MKNLIILGVPRAGKSHLSAVVSKQLVANGYATTILPADIVLSCLDKCKRKSLSYNILRIAKHVFPFLNKMRKQKLINDMSLFVKNFIRNLPDDKVLVFEGAYIGPDVAARYFDLSNTKIVVIGYPNADIEQKMQDIRKYHHGVSPLIKKTDEQLHARVQAYINQSRTHWEYCKSNNIMFIDTSVDYHGAINSFAENVTEFLQ